MMKGVSHRVIEINRPESVYFERAVLYLRPEAGDAPFSAVCRDAEKCLGIAGICRKRHLRGWAWFLLGAVCSAGGTAVVLLLR